MYQLIRPGRMIFGTGIAALGVLQFLVKDFIVARPPAAAWAADIPGKLAWAYVSGVLLILCGVAIILNKRGGAAALFTALLIFISSFITRNLPDMFGVKTAENLLWKVNAYKALAFCGGALIIAASFFREGEPYPAKFAGNRQLITTGSILFALFMIIGGLAHFKFADFVKDLIPRYIGLQYFWTYFCAVALLAGGIGLIIPSTRKWAAVFSGLMILLWFMLLHIPRAVTIAPETSVPVYSEWMGVFESFAFSGVLFVLTGLTVYKRIGSKPGVAANN